MTKRQQPHEWDCPHGKRHAIGCRRCQMQAEIDRCQQSALSVPNPVVSCGRQIPRKPGCP